MSGPRYYEELRAMGCVSVVFASSPAQETTPIVFPKDIDELLVSYIQNTAIDSNMTVIGEWPENLFMDMLDIFHESSLATPKEPVAPFRFPDLDDSQDDLAIPKSEQRAKLSARQASLLDELENGNITATTQAASWFNVTSRTIRRDLRILEDLGFVERLGNTKGTEYRVRGI